MSCSTWTSRTLQNRGSSEFKGTGTWMWMVGENNPTNRDTRGGRFRSVDRTDAMAPQAPKHTRLFLAPSEVCRTSTAPIERAAGTDFNLRPSWRTAPFKICRTPAPASCRRVSPDHARRYCCTCFFFPSGPSAAAAAGGAAAPAPEPAVASFPSPASTKSASNLTLLHCIITHPEMGCIIEGGADITRHGNWRRRNTAGPNKLKAREKNSQNA